MFSKVDPNVKKQVTEAKSKNNDASKSKGVVFLAWGLPASKSLKEAGITHVRRKKLALFAIDVANFPALLSYRVHQMY